jgi:TetR/AcrR family transcriptional regulator, fatty acid metabolism regulator protein
MALRAAKFETPKAEPRAASPIRAASQPRAVGQWGAREAGILEVAGRLYATRGYERVSMADVATAAGLSEGTLYNYFRDKTDLVLSVGLVSLERNIAGAAKITEEATSLEDGLRQLIAHQLRSLLSAPEMYRIWLREVKAAEGYGKSRARDALRRFSAQFSLFLDRWHPQSASLPLEASMMRDMFYGGIEQIAWTAIVQGRKRAVDIDDTAAKLAFAYLAAFGLALPAKSPLRKTRKAAISR